MLEEIIKTNYLFNTHRKCSHFDWVGCLDKMSICYSGWFLLIYTVEIFPGTSNHENRSLPYLFIEIKFPNGMARTIVIISLHLIPYDMILFAVVSGHLPND